MINRVLSDNLTITDKVYWKNGDIFSGVVFWKDNNKLLNAKNVLNGSIVSDYIPICLPNHKATSLIMYSDDAISEDYEYDFIRIEGCKDTFTGIIIWFEDNGYSAGESYYSNSHLLSDIGWYLDDGSIESYKFDFDWFQVQTEWYKGNFIKSYQIWHNSNLTIQFNEINEVVLLNIDWDFFKYINDFLKYNEDIPFKSYEELLNLKYSKNISFLYNFNLSVDNIEHNLIMDLLINNSLINTQNISFYQVNNIDEKLLNKINKDYNIQTSVIFS
jgi:hypothetical protein